MIDKTKIDLNAPAFGENAQKLEEQKSTVTPTEVSQTKEEIEEGSEGKKEPVTSSTETDDGDETRVPYSRFKSVHQRAIEAERVAQEANDKYEQLLSKSSQKQESEDIGPYKGNLPSYWLKLYGDSDVSREAFAIELERQNEIKDEARREAIEAVKNERYVEAKQLEQNISVIDENLEDLKAQLGRDLTDDEESTFLDVVDEYSPKDEDGNYTSLISFNKAWEIHEMRKERESSSSRKSRSAVASLTSSKTEGEPSSDIKTQQDFNPRDWNAYKKRLGN